METRISPTVFAWSEDPFLRSFFIPEHFRGAEGLKQLLAVNYIHTCNISSTSELVRQVPRALPKKEPLSPLSRQNDFSLGSLD